MAVASRFESWQTTTRNPDRPPYESCSPNITTIVAHLIRVWGGQSLGCHVNRDTRSGGAISSHAFGAAGDWRYPNRQTLLEQIIPFLIQNSDELGVQAIHDYVGARIWRPPGTSGRPVGGDGWKPQTRVGNMGDASSTWIHVETHPDRFLDATPILKRLDHTPTQPAEYITIDTEDPNMILNFNQTPKRVYDSATSGGTLKDGETRKIALGYTTVAVVNVTAAGTTGGGYLSIAGVNGAGNSTSITNYDADGQSNGTWAGACPDGHIYVTATGGPCRLIVDLMVTGSGS